MDAQNSAADADLAAVFASFCAFGKGGSGSPAPSPSLPALAAARLDSRGFAKMVRDAGGLGLAPALVDLAFKAAAAGPGGDGRRVGWAGFLAAVDAVAVRKGVPAEDVRAALASAGGPRLAPAATGPPPFIKFHDDRGTYTGVHARGGGGGPTNVDGPRTLSALCDRAKKANVRGVPAGYGAGR